MTAMRMDAVERSDGGGASLERRSGSSASSNGTSSATTPEPEPRRIYATLLTKATYLPGVLVLASSLAATSARYPLVVLVTEGLDANSRMVLQSAGLAIREVPYLQPKTKKAFAAHDLRFEDTWTKLAVFGLEEYERVVLLDADMLVLRSPDHLIELDLPADHVAASHACTCNPRKLAHYPVDWCVADGGSADAAGCPSTARTRTRKAASRSRSRRTRDLRSIFSTPVPSCSHPLATRWMLLQRRSPRIRSARTCVRVQTAPDARSSPSLIRTCSLTSSRTDFSPLATSTTRSRRCGHVTLPFGAMRT